jgi:diguanylate cyclase (GGDEF)-like protein
VIGIDVDHFKKVNDTLGHAAGDRLLRDIGQLIRSAIRERDMAFRLGGDEFLILLPENDARAGLQLAQRLSAMVDQLAVTVHSQPKPGLSMGVICLTQFRGVTPADVLHQADEAMYEDKAARKARR